MIRKIIHFSGDVQGVGFRYTACSVARGFDVAGYVRNCRNGSVELVVEFPATHLIGMSVRTNMQNAQTDCPAIWQTFGPRIIEIPGGDCIGKGAYGVSIMLNENDFDYWAAVEVSSNATVPKDMGTFEIPAGLYAKCNIASLEKLGEAYMYVYGQWIPGQSEYGLNMQAPCFELYPPNWNLEDAFEIYVPVTKQ